MLPAVHFIINNTSAFAAQHCPKNYLKLTNPVSVSLDSKLRRKQFQAGQQGDHVMGRVFLTGLAAVDGEVAPLAHKGFAETGTSAQHLAGV